MPNEKNIKTMETDKTITSALFVKAIALTLIGVVVLYLIILNGIECDEYIWDYSQYANKYSLGNRFAP